MAADMEDQEKMKKREYNKQYGDRNRAKLNEDARLYRLKNKDEIRKRYMERFKVQPESTRQARREYCRQYNIDNKEQLKEYGKEYREKNKDLIYIRNKTWVDNNGELARAYAKKWWRENKEAASVYHNRRRTRLQGGDLTPDSWRAVLASWNGACASCQTVENIAMDHCIPVSIGGKNSVDNVQPLCRSCNSSKGAKAFSYLRPIFKGINS